MSTTLSHERRALPVARQELSFAAQQLQGRRYWTVKDPVRLRYFQLREEEYFVLKLLDGQHSLDEIVTAFDQRFAPRRLRKAELSGFVTMLHREGLTVASAYGQSEHLLARRSKAVRTKWINRLLNVLAIKLPGVNPDRWLSTVVPRLRWLFSPLLLVASALLVVAAALLITVDLPAVLARLPKLHELIGPSNFVSMVVALAIVKTLHELGHAIACKHFGGRCHRLGIMLLLFTPAMYCDVSDSWMFPNRWKRIAVSAAGMVVELILAALALVLWSVTQPGWFNTLVLNMVFICSVGTLLINGNPLLRYDGYFIFSDLIGAPNLHEQAQSLLRRWFAWIMTGVELPPSPTLAPPRTDVLLAYGVLSWAYRWLMIIGMLWLVHTALAPLGLAIVAQAIAVLVLASQAVGPGYQAFHFLSDAMQRNTFDWRRLTIASAGLTLVVAMVLAIPLPKRVTAPLLLQPAGARQVYVTTPGVLQSAVAPESEVKQGQVIASLANSQLELEIADLVSQVEQQRLTVKHWELRRHQDSTIGEGLPVAQQGLADLTAQLAQKRREQAELSLIAPQSGKLLLARTRSDDTADALPNFSGTPLDAANIGCYLSTGTLLCSVGDPQHVEALVIVSEADVPHLAIGQTARLRVDEVPNQILTGKVAEISPLKAKDLPDTWLASGAIPVERDARGRWKPQGNYFQATIALDPHSAPMLSGGLGTAKINVAADSLFTRAYRALRGTFRLPF